MPKHKTRKSAIKRFKISKNGKISRRRSFTSHLKVKKTAKRLRNLKKNISVTGQYEKRLKKALGIRKSRKNTREEGALQA
jgi:large subunit ribosomal protein L35